MRWTMHDGAVCEGYADAKRYYEARGLDPSYLRHREQKGLARRKEGPRTVRLPDYWRAMLDSIFGPSAVVEFVKDIPVQRPAISVLVNALDTGWFHRMQAEALAMCLIRGRINYVDVATGKQLKGNPKGTALLLFTNEPPDVVKFAAALRPHGTTSYPF